MKKIYDFPAIFQYADDGISIFFPDLPGCLPCGMAEDEALNNAREALGLHLFGMEQDNEPIPAPSHIKDLSTSENEVIVLIDVFMPSIRSRVKNRYVKKTLSVPAWLDAEAERANINFSQTLQEGLYHKLGIEPSSLHNPQG